MSFDWQGLSALLREQSSQLEGQKEPEELGLSGVLADAQRAYQEGWQNWKPQTYSGGADEEWHPAPRHTGGDDLRITGTGTPGAMQRQYGGGYDPQYGQSGFLEGPSRTNASRELGYWDTFGRGARYVGGKLVPFGSTAMSLYNKFANNRNENHTADLMSQAMEEADWNMEEATKLYDERIKAAERAAEEQNKSVWDHVNDGNAQWGGFDSNLAMNQYAPSFGAAYVGPTNRRYAGLGGMFLGTGYDPYAQPWAAGGGPMAAKARARSY